MADTIPTTTNTTDASSVTTTSTVKPGWKTSEFWLSMAATVIGALTTDGVIGAGTEAAKIAGVALIALASLGYTYSRTMVKS